MTVREAAELFQRAGVAFDTESSGRRVNRCPVAEAPKPIDGPVEARLMLHGHCPSKKSLYRVTLSRRLMIREDAKAQIESLTLQAMLQWGQRGPVEHPNMTIRFFVTTARQDEDGMWITIVDILQNAGVLVNDNIARNNGRKIHEPCQFVAPGDERVEIDLIKG